METNERSLAQMLYFEYLDWGYQKTEDMRLANEDVKAAIGDASFWDEDRLWTAVGALTAAHEQAAFEAGLRMGKRLLELLNPV